MQGWKGGAQLSSGWSFSHDLPRPGLSHCQTPTGFDRRLKCLLRPPLHILLLSSKASFHFPDHSTLSLPDSFSSDHHAHPRPPGGCVFLECKYLLLRLAPHPQAGRPRGRALGLSFSAGHLAGTWPTFVCPIHSQMRIIKRPVVRSIVTNTPPRPRLFENTSQAPGLYPSPQSFFGGMQDRLAFLQSASLGALWPRPAPPGRVLEAARTDTTVAAAS